MPRAYHTRTAEHTFGKRPAVVRTGSTHGVKVIANTRQQDSSFVDRDFFHLAVAELESIRKVKFSETHCSFSGHTDEMAHLLLLGLEVLDERIVRLDFERHTLDDFEPCLSQRLDLRGVVRHHTH